MEKLDAIVALAGGVVLLVAIVGAALSGGAQTAAYDLTVTESTHAATRLAFGVAPGGGRANGSFDVPDANVSQVRVKVFVNSTAFPTGATAHVVLTSPANESVEKDGQVTGPAAAAFLAVEVAFDVASKPNATRVQATSVDDAIRQAAAPHATAAQGAWSVEVSYSPGGPVPPADVSLAVLPAWTTWSVNATLAAPVSR